MKNKRQLIAVLVIILGLLGFYTVSRIFSTPSVSHLRWHIPKKTAFMKDCDTEIQRQYVPLSKISLFLKQAVILAEDDRFPQHDGIDWKAIMEAFKRNWKRKRISHGASTITMQLAKNLYLSPRRSPFRKIKEMLIALKLERELSKDRILEIYLNVAEFGCGIFGAEAAAKHYFGGSARYLDKHQAAFLAAILPRPCFYDKHRWGAFLQERIQGIEGRL
ncbi:MAG: monofunctional biosynthetic peptidoglycan transglycosylase [Deltaproteobacteria bacterium]|nr:monofunctional biosynthetic peptidoglycan transglycosylase [Deltaproteobacteria bacterium]